MAYSFNYQDIDIADQEVYFNGSHAMDVDIEVDIRMTDDGWKSDGALVIYKDSQGKTINETIYKPKDHDQFMEDFGDSLYTFIENDIGEMEAELDLRFDPESAYGVKNNQY